MEKFLLNVYNKIAQLTLGQLFEKFFRLFCLVTISFLVRSCLSFFPFPILLPPKELIDKISFILNGKFGIVFVSEVSTEPIFKAFYNIFGSTSSRLEPLPSVSLSSPDSFPPVSAEDRGPSSETKKGFSYKKVLIGGVCLAGVIFLFLACGGGNDAQTKLLIDIAQKVDYIAKEVTLLRAVQVAVNTDVNALPDFVDKVWPGLKDTVFK